MMMSLIAIPRRLVPGFGGGHLWRVDHEYRIIRLVEVRLECQGVVTFFRTLNLVVDLTPVDRDADLVERTYGDGGDTQGYSHFARVSVGDQNLWPRARPDHLNGRDPLSKPSHSRARDHLDER